jgi:quinoprotein relay system zinc metallohydrolase 2
MRLRSTRRLLSLAWALGAASVWASADELQVLEIAPGVYLHEGVQEVASAQNRGHIANLGFIVGSERVAVIDSGGSFQEGAALRRAVREVTQLPIAYLILTHVHPDHTLGAAAFAEDGAEVIGHANLADAQARRGPFYLGRAQELLGAQAEGTRVVMPTVGVEVGTVRLLDLGGRTLELRAYPTAHTNNDLSVYDGATGTLWLSDLLFVQRIPVVDGSLLGWLRVMSDLERAEARRVVPGHGPLQTDWRPALGEQRRYLEALATGIRREIHTQGDIRRAVETVGLEERDRWLLFDEYHGRNVTAGFVELEWE